MPLNTIMREFLRRIMHAVESFSPGNVVDSAGNVLPVRHAQVTLTTAGNQLVVAPVANRRLRIVKFKIAIAGAVNVYWIEYNPLARLSSTTYLAAQGGWTDDGFYPPGYWQTALNRTLGLNLSANIDVGVDVWYVEVP